jgi:hypothetical protein
MLEEIADRIANAQRLLGEVARIEFEDPDDNAKSVHDSDLDAVDAELTEVLDMIERFKKPVSPPATIPFDQAPELRVMTEGESQ